MSVPDALMRICARRDASLAVRHSRIDACKECALRVDGKVRYACMARLGGGTVTVGPLANKPRRHGLATDTAPAKKTRAQALGEGDDSGR